MYLFVVVVIATICSKQLLVPGESSVQPTGPTPLVNTSTSFSKIFPASGPSSLMVHATARRLITLITLSLPECSKRGNYATSRSSPPYEARVIKDQHWSIVNGKHHLTRLF